MLQFLDGCPCRYFTLQIELYINKIGPIPQAKNNISDYHQCRKDTGLWGNTFDIDKAIEQFRKWQKVYGDIYRLNIAGLKVIMVCRLNCHLSSRIKREKVSHTGRIQIKVVTTLQFVFLLFLASNDNIKNKSKMCNWWRINTSNKLKM